MANHRVHPSTRAERFEIENLSRVPGDAYRYPTEKPCPLIRIIRRSKHRPSQQSQETADGVLALSRL
jgi:hypothetical protein